MVSKKSILFVSILLIIVVITTSYITFYLLAQNTISNPFTKISGTIEPDDEAIFLTTDTYTITNTFWKIGKNGNTVKPIYEFTNEFQLDSIAVSPDNTKIAATNMFNQVFLYIINLETNKTNKLNYGNPYDKNDLAINAFIWTDNDTLLLNHSSQYTEEPLSTFTKINLLENNELDMSEIGCPSLNINFGKPKLLQAANKDVIYYFTGNNNAELVSCNITNDEVDTTLNITSKSPADWFIDNERVIIIENDITGDGTYQEIKHTVIIHDLLTKDTTSVSLGGEYHMYTMVDTNSLHFTDSERLCVKKLNLKDVSINEVICNDQYTNYLSTGKYIYYITNESEEDSAVILNRYDTLSAKLSKTKIPHSGSIQNFKLF